MLKTEVDLLGWAFDFYYTANNKLASASNQIWTLPLLFWLISVVNKVYGYTPKTDSLPTKYCFLAKLLWVTFDIPHASSASPAALSASGFENGCADEI